MVLFSYGVTFIFNPRYGLVATHMSSLPKVAQIWFDDVGWVRNILR